MAAGLCAAWPFRKTLLDEEEDFSLSATPAAVTTTVGATAASSRPPGDPSEKPSLAGQDGEPESGLAPLIAALDQGPPKRDLVKLDQTVPLPRLPGGFVSQSSDVAREPRVAVPPEPEPSAAAAGRPSPPRDRRYYRIRRHDTLEDIAERMLGSRQHADKLQAANPDVILVREILPVGATIDVPDLHEPTETIVRLPAGN
jgi:phage tail protein X